MIVSAVLAGSTVAVVVFGSLAVWEWGRGVVGAWRRDRAVERSVRAEWERRRALSGPRVMR